MDEQNSKPTTNPSPKAFDIFKPGQSSPPATARPIIVNRQAPVADSTVTGKPEAYPAPISVDAPAEQPHRQILDAHDKITLQPPADAEAAEQPFPPEAAAPEPEPQEAVHVPISDAGDQTSEVPAPQPQERPTAIQINTPADPAESQAAATESPASVPAQPQLIPAEQPDNQPQPTDDELLLPAHTTSDPAEDQTDAANQFVVSHHKTSRQKWMKRILIALLLLAIIGAAIGFALWRQSNNMPHLS